MSKLQWHTWVKRDIVISHILHYIVYEFQKFIRIFSVNYLYCSGLFSDKADVTERWKNESDEWSFVRCQGIASDSDLHICYFNLIYI